MEEKVDKPDVETYDALHIRQYVQGYEVPKKTILPQLKLLEGEVAFMDWALSHGKLKRKTVVVYVGAAGGSHLPHLIKEYPKIHFDLFGAHNSTIANIEKLQRNNVRVYRRYWTYEDAASYVGWDVIFITDHRTARNSNPTSDEKLQDLRDTHKWLESFGSLKAASIKFSPPYDKSDSKIVFNYDKIWLQIHAPPRSTEVRLWWTCDIKTSKDIKLTETFIKNHQNKMCFYNTNLTQDKSNARMDLLVTKHPGLKTYVDGLLKPKKQQKPYKMDIVNPKNKEFSTFFERHYFKMNQIQFGINPSKTCGHPCLRILRDISTQFIAHQTKGKIVHNVYGGPGRSDRYKLGWHCHLLEKTELDRTKYQNVQLGKKRFSHRCKCDLFKNPFQICNKCDADLERKNELVFVFEDATYKMPREELEWYIINSNEVWTSQHIFSTNGTKGKYFGEADWNVDQYGLVSMTVGGDIYAYSHDNHKFVTTWRSAGYVFTCENKFGPTNQLASYNVWLYRCYPDDGKKYQLSTLSDNKLNTKKLLLRTLNRKYGHRIASENLLRAAKAYLAKEASFCADLHHDVLIQWAEQHFDRSRVIQILGRGVERERDQINKIESDVQAWTHVLRSLITPSRTTQLKITQGLAAFIRPIVKAFVYSAGLYMALKIIKGMWKLLGMYFWWSAKRKTQPQPAKVFRFGGKEYVRVKTTNGIQLIKTSTLSEKIKNGLDWFGSKVNFQGVKNGTNKMYSNMANKKASFDFLMGYNTHLSSEEIDDLKYRLVCSSLDGAMSAANRIMTKEGEKLQGMFDAISRVQHLYTGDVTLVRKFYEKELAKWKAMERKMKKSWNQKQLDYIKSQVETWAKQADEYLGNKIDDGADLVEQQYNSWYKNKPTRQLNDNVMIIKTAYPEDFDAASYVDYWQFILYLKRLGHPIWFIAIVAGYYFTRTAKINKMKIRTLPTNKIDSGTMIRKFTGDISYQKRSIKRICLNETPLPALSKNTKVLYDDMSFICKEQIGAYSQGPVLPIVGYLQQNCPHNCLLTYCTRAAFDLPTKYKRNYFEPQAFVEFVVHTLNRKLYIFGDIDKRQPMPLEEWKLRYTGEKLNAIEKHMHDAEAIVLGATYYDGHLYSRGAFIKDEFSLKFNPLSDILELGQLFDDFKFNPRLIQGQNIAVNIAIGRAMATFNEMMKKRFSGQCDFAYYASGSNRQTLGKMFYERYQRMADPVIIESDMSRYDRHMAPHILKLMSHILSWHVELDEAMIKVLKSWIMGCSGKMSAKVEKQFWSLVYSVMGQMGSGAQCTTVFNSIFLICVLREIFETRSPFAQYLWYAVVLGDDNQTLMERALWNILQNHVETDVERLGLHIEIKEVKDYEAEFCSSLWIPCSIEEDGKYEDTWLLTPKMGRVFAKTFYSFEELGERKGLEYILCIIKGLYNETSHIPGIKYYWDHMLDLLGKLEIEMTDKVMKNMHKWMPRKAKLWAPTKPARATYETFEYLYDRYGISENEQKAWMEFVDKIEYPVHVLNHEYVWRFFVADVFGFYFRNDSDFFDDWVDKLKNGTVIPNERFYDKYNPTDLHMESIYSRFAYVNFDPYVDLSINGLYSDVDPLLRDRYALCDIYKWRCISEDEDEKRQIKVRWCCSKMQGDCIHELNGILPVSYGIDGTWLPSDLEMVNLRKSVRWRSIKSIKNYKSNKQLTWQSFVKN